MAQWNVNALVLESAQAREDRKKRKELKRLARAQQSQPQTPLPQIQTPAPPSSPAVAGTPRPSVTRPGSAKPSLAPVQVHGLPSARAPGTSTPRTNTPHPLSAPPVSASSLHVQQTVAQAQQSARGQKRVREESTAVNIAHPPTPQPANQPPKAIIGAKAGTAGVRPRPFKKQRMVSCWFFVLSRINQKVLTRSAGHARPGEG